MGHEKWGGLDAGEMVQRCQPTTYKCHRSSFLLFCQKLPLASGLTVCSNQDQAFDYQQKTSMTSHPFVFLMVLPAMILEWHDTTKITIAITNSCSLKNAEKISVVKDYRTCFVFLLILGQNNPIP